MNAQALSQSANRLKRRYLKTDTGEMNAQALSQSANRLKRRYLKTDTGEMNAQHRRNHSAAQGADVSKQKPAK